MGNVKNSTASWVFPAVVGALVALIGSGGTYYLTNWKNTREHTRGVATVRAQIIESAIGKNKNLTAARLTLDYVLEPIDETGEFEEFSKKIVELFAEQDRPGVSARAERRGLSPHDCNLPHCAGQRSPSPGPLRRGGGGDPGNAGRGGRDP